MKIFRSIPFLSMIVFLGIIAGFVVVTVDPIGLLQRNRNAERKKDLTAIQKALNAYYLYHGRYPAQAGATDFRIRGVDGEIIPWAGAWVPYLPQVPEDPQSPQRDYVYIAPDSNGQTYYVYASVENGGKEKDACNKGRACSTIPQGVLCGKEVCNYGISSTNTTP